ncbi:MAG: PAS domain S-box protein, partial [Dissulfurispiraceae bacterium]
MKIRTRLRLNTFISIGGVILILFSLVWAFREGFRANRNLELAEEMRKVALDRILLRDDYLLYQEERAVKQWHARSDVLRGLFDLADTRFEKEEYKVLLRAARREFDSTFSGFFRVIEGHKSRYPATEKSFDFTEVESKLINQVFLNDYTLTDSINRLHESVQNTATNTRTKASFIIAIFSFGVVTLIILNSAVTGRTIAKRLAVLGKGVEIIGAGDLDYRIRAEGDDELSALALASNEMASKLKVSYTSMENLNKEITDRKLAEDALQISEKQLRDVTSYLAEGIYVLDQQGNIIFMNPTAEQFLGWTMTELKNKNVHNVIHHRKVDGTPLSFEDCPMRNVIKTGKMMSSTDEIFIRKDGTAFPVSVISSPIMQNGKAVASVSAFRDITEQKRMEKDRERLIFELGLSNEELEHEIVERQQAEMTITSLNQELESRIISRTAQLEAINVTLQDEISRHRKSQEDLKESVQRFQLAAESGQLGVWDWNMQSNFMVWNNRMLELYGISRDAFPNSVEAWVNGLHPDDSVRAIAECDAALRGEKAFDAEFRVLHPDGTVKVLKANALVIRDSGGKPVRMLGLNRDITELREAEEKLHRAYSDLEIKVQERTAELTAAKHQLEELNLSLERRVNKEIASRQEKEQLLFQQSRMAAMGEMIGAIAHQWRQPLNVIGLIIQNLQMAYEYGELDKERLKNAVATAMWQINFMSKTIDDFRNFFKPSKEKENFD